MTRHRLTAAVVLLGALALAATTSISQGGFVGTATDTLAMGAFDITSTTGTGVLKRATATLNATNIVGTAAGDLANSTGTTIVAGVAGKVIVPVLVYIEFTYSTAAYTGGSQLFSTWAHSTLGTNTPHTTTITHANSLGASTDRYIVLPIDDATGFNATATFVGIDYVLKASAEITQPGTAAGTATVYVVYYLLTVP